jgi:FkbM family methyltransferase
MDAIDVDGVVDDFAREGTVFKGKPVCAMHEVPDGAIIVNCSLCAGPVSAARRLAALAGVGVLSVANLCRAFPRRFAVPEFIRLTRDELSRNGGSWQRLAHAFADEESRSTLDNLIRFRLTGDHTSMQSYTVRPHEQYFESFVGLTEEAVFVDAGGYDGDTTEVFCKRCPRYRRVYLFEPCRANIEKARSRLSVFRDIEFIEEGLSDAVGTLSFDAEAGSASTVCPTGSSSIKVTTLDERIDQPVTFIKMDLEGWELHALKGAKRHIGQEAPSLAIAVYHSAADFRTVFEYVMALRPDYRVYLRHYTEGWSETVMFFCRR